MIKYLLKVGGSKTEKDIYSNGVALLEEWEDVNYCVHKFKFKDEWLTDKEVVDLLSQLNDENECLREIMGIMPNDDVDDIVNVLNYQESDKRKFQKENEQLKEHIKSLEKELYLIHMQSMFSTVKSFKGDVSKRYKYSEETDTIYDTANNYGQFNKILDKKEITMLLNEYETILKELEE